MTGLISFVGASCIFVLAFLWIRYVKRSPSEILIESLFGKCSCGDRPSRPTGEPK